MTARPSPFYQQHHEVEEPRVDELAYRPYWRRRTKLDRLLLDGAIPPATWRAAMRFRRAVEAVRVGFLPERHDDSRGHTGIPGARYGRQIDARAYLARVRTAIGVFAFGIIEWCVVEDLTWSALGARLCVDPKTARTWVIAALAALAAYEQQPP